MRHSSQGVRTSPWLLTTSLEGLELGVAMATPSPARRHSPLKLLPQAAGVIAILTGGLGLLGRAFGIEALMTGLPGLPRMPANTALSIVLAGVSLWLVWKEPVDPRLRRASQGAAAVVLLVGLLTLSEYLIGWDLGIDQALFQEISGSPGTAYPGRPAPHAALNLALVGLALLILDAETRRGFRPAEFLGLGAALLSLTTLVGYAFGVAPFFGPSPLAGMALPATLALLVLSAGILTARPGRGLMAALTSETPSSVMARRMLLIVVSLPLLFGALALAGQRAGLYDIAFVASASVATVIAGLIIVILGTARSHVRKEEERHRAMQRLEAQEAAARALSEAETLGEASPRMLQSVCEYLEWDTGEIWLVDVKANALRCEDVWCSPTLPAAAADVTEFQATTRQLTFAPGVGLPGRVWATGEPHWIEDIRRDSGSVLGLVATKNGLHGAVAVPIEFRGEILGVAGFFDTNVRPRDDLMLSMMTVLGSQIGQFIKRMEVEGTLVTSERRLSGALDLAMVCIITVDERQRVLFFDPRAEKIFGYTAQEALGQPLSLLIPSRFEESHDGHFREFAAGAETVLRMDERRDVYGRHKDGTEFPAEASIFKSIKDGKATFTAVLRDITERKRAEAALKDYARQLEGLNKELEAFSYSVAHDLRAPLRAIDGFSQVLLEDYGDKLESQAQDHLRRVRAGSQRMARLIDDMLTLSRITRAELRHERVDLSAVAQEVAAELRGTQPERQVEFDVASGLVVRGDSRLLRVVMENLFGNAWKFTGKKPRAKIEFGLTQYDGKAAYFVRDDGAGFDMAYADKLFGAFQRLHSPTEYPGTGIGLATVQRIVHRHGGRVWAEGKPDRGATFYFTLS